MGLFKTMWKNLRTTPVDTLVRWQEQRFLWLLMVVVMGGLIVLAHSFFQIYLYMAPCEQCVYIRFAMFVMVIGGLIAAINPKIIVLKLIGCIAAFYGAITGMGYSIKLNGIHHAVHNPDPDALFGVQGCSTDPTFPFGLPLADWSPEWFKPTGDCGYDAPIVPDGVTLNSIQQWFIDMYVQAEGWYLIPSWQFMNMAQACFLAFGMCFIILVIMTLAWIIKLARGNKPVRMGSQIR
ncbi:protein-disulfide oxidoreductase DsbI [Budviciaceae bacterium CWB-B4]|uniref:Protein-disulfide oxidoreductase DsbI n=1 Tax=Limnobaculum xujianqingii TaxID=2738837 RepID=A0A9D7AF06_9GAMM|nr:protein-disulfide oxidoreductase DsbI [Limnobaculum xujianqingii]MBK5071515.1 protein-disulfide oxidoreductase DsbI [Limnobaculum xujianqingii]MBK5174824.1 protein-disulfide oxidoreductase DsbI [Limnobaculum xujianqingii]